MTWERTNNFAAPTECGKNRFESFHNWLDDGALCLLENEQGVMIVCHMDDVKAVEAALKQSGAHQVADDYEWKTHSQNNSGAT